MTRPPLRYIQTLGLALIWSLTSWIGIHAAEERPPTNPGRFLTWGDIHFDPFAGLTRAEFDELMTAPLAQWPSRLRSQPAPVYGADSPYSLLQSSLDDARTRLPNPDWVLIPGDFLAHDWPGKYDQLAPRSRAKDPAAYHAFTRKVMEFLVNRLRLAFPTAAILPVLGNEDSYCGDYQLTPQSSFLQMFAETCSPLLFPNSSNRTEQLKVQETLTRGGYYTIRLPYLRRHRLIALNTVFLAPQYNNACGDSTTTPARDQFHWLESVLTAAESADETVWLLMHVPPGIDSFATLQAKNGPQPFWQPELTAWFLQLLARHEERIQFSFAGHTHMDDFRLVQLGQRPVLVTKVVPGISPIFGNNPGYHLVTYDAQSGQIADYQTYSYHLNGTDPRSWNLEYTFSRTYVGFSLEPASLARLGRELSRAGDLGITYRRLYPVSGPLTPITLGSLGCAFLSTTVGEYQACQNSSLSQPQ